uniref:glutathione transferase n=1 Tax=Timema monikensis TaxID=170555 RepID=A0A7R9EBG4_9NEOP|nr:unnamed protein product [Timema monikensis]
MSLKLYYDLLSQPSRAVMLFLLGNKIPFERKEINLKYGDHQSEEFGRLNPFRKVPVIVDGNFPLTESVAILRYLCREKQVRDHWYPRDSKLQAKVDEYLEWQHLDTRLNCSTYFLNKFLIPAVTGKPPKPEKVAESLKHMERTLNKIEDVWLAGDKPYLTGEQISIADLLAACEVEQTRMAGYDPGKVRPRLSAWLERVGKDLHPHYKEVHKILRKIQEKHKARLLRTGRSRFESRSGELRVASVANALVVFSSTAEDGEIEVRISVG